MKNIILALAFITSNLFAQSVNGIANQTVIGNSAFVAGSGAANVLTACPSPAITAQALTAGIVIHVRPNTANTTTTPTFNLCSLSAVTIVKASGGSLIALAAGDYATGVDATFYYTGSFWQLMNPQTGAGGIPYPGAGIPNSTGTAWGTSYTAQGTDTKVLTASTVSGTSATLCTDANGGATTVSCPSGGGGSLVLLEAHTASNSAELDFTASLSGVYDEYVIEFLNIIPATSGVSMSIQFSSNGGTSYDSTSGHYESGTWFWVITGANIIGGNLSTGLVVAGSMQNSTGVYSGTFKLYDPNNSAVFPSIIGSMGGPSSTNSNILTRRDLMGRYLQNVTSNAFRIILSSGNITSGTVRCYGLAH